MKILLLYSSSTTVQIEIRRSVRSTTEGIESKKFWERKKNMLLFMQSVKVMFAILVLNVIVTEMRPNSAPYPQNEDFLTDESSSPNSDDTPMNADSFPLAPDVQDAPRMRGTHDHHTKKLLA